MTAKVHPAGPPLQIILNLRDGRIYCCRRGVAPMRESSAMRHSHSMLRPHWPGKGLFLFRAFDLL